MTHMEEVVANKPYKLDDHTTSDVTVILTNREGKPDHFNSHSAILINNSHFFGDLLSQPDSRTTIKIHCSGCDYDHHVQFLNLLYLPAESLITSLHSVKSAINILQIAVNFHCNEITQSCIHYLEAMPWEDKEEEDIIKLVSKLGPVAMPILARIQPVTLKSAKNVFLSAVRFATSISEPFPPFGDELKTSAQEQIEYMLGEDEDTSLIKADDEVKLEVRKGLSKICSSFESELSSTLLESSELDSDRTESRLLQCCTDLEWVSNILSKMDMMKDFVLKWVEISDNVLKVMEDEKLEAIMWGFKVKLTELTGKAFEAVGYGNVVLSASQRVKLVKTWLPYVRKLKPILDIKCSEDTEFVHKMDEDLCQSIEGAMVSLVLALPSNDQADILSDWMSGVSVDVKFPDLSEAFEVWCYRTKSAKRRLEDGIDRVGNTNATVGLL